LKAASANGSNYPEFISAAFFVATGIATAGHYPTFGQQLE